ARFSQKGASKRFSDRPRMAAMPGVPRAAGARCDIALRSLHTRPGVIAPLLKFTLIRASRRDRLRSGLARKVTLIAARRGGYTKQITPRPAAGLSNGRGRRDRRGVARRG